MERIAVATSVKIATIFATAKLDFMPKIPNWVFVLLGILLFSAVRVPIMDIDAAQYSEMSREMSISGDWLHLYDRGWNYLDKPPFLFWVTSFSMKLFGATNFAYRLPSILF